VTATGVAAADWSGMIDSCPSDSSGTARALAAQAEARAQPWVADPLSSKLA